MESVVTGSGAPVALAADQVVSRCDPAVLGFTLTTDAEPLAGIVGQSRALESLRLGSRMRAEGFNVYVLGTPGSQRHEVVQDFLNTESQRMARPVDWCYVNNFADPRKATGIALAPGQAKRLRTDMTQLVEDLVASIPAAFESENYRNRLAEIEHDFNEHIRQAQEVVDTAAREEGLGLMPTPRGFAIAPVRDGKPISEEAFNELPEDEQEKTQAAVERVSHLLAEYFEQLPAFHKERRRRRKELENNVTMFAVGSLIAEVRKRYEDNQGVVDYLDAVQQDVVDNAEDFRPQAEGAEGVPQALRRDPADRFKRYEVNVLIDNAERSGAPVVYQSNPTYQNLVGRVEHASEFGALTTNFTMIRPGALHAANGGFLIVDVEKVLLQPYAWEGLKRAIHTREIRIESLGQMLSLVSTQGLEPDPMPLDVKIVLVGNRMLYYMLCALDEQFQQYFKVAADFEDRIPRSEDNLRLYGRMLAAIAQRKALRPFSAEAIARVIDEGTRWIGDAHKLSARMRPVADLMSEADYCAASRDGETVQAEDVERAIAQRVFRVDRIRSDIYESIDRQTVHISTDGEAVGQVNGLSVLQLGDFMFGQPSRITATARLGAGKVVDIEREVELGGSIHSKGVLILSSYLASRYAADVPLSLSASLVFEQSYGHVDGDSASVAELAALVSAIAGLPLRQSLAMTGSIDQQGRVQAIGGVNQKIEGFFDVCRARGLSGEQGVMIPADNVQHLMLRADVVEAIAAGRFAVYPLRHVDDALTLLCRIAAGKADAEGRFPDDSVNGRVAKALAELAHRRRRYAAGPGESGKSEAEP